jgi:hypothetical protein
LYFVQEGWCLWVYYTVTREVVGVFCAFFRYAAGRNWMGSVAYAALRFMWVIFSCSSPQRGLCPTELCVKALLAVALKTLCFDSGCDAPVVLRVDDDD